MTPEELTIENCVESCMTATNPICICGCGGKNHAILTTERLDEVMPE